VARLDRFLAVMRDQGGEAIRLAPGEPAALRKNGMIRPMTREALTEQQVLGLLREVAPPEAAERLSGHAEVAFTYQGPDGVVEVRVAPEGDSIAATVRSLFPEPARAAAPVPPGDGGPDLSAPRARIDGLFRMLREQGGSDLHLKTGSPPILRKDGHLLPVEQPPLTAEDVELMLRSVMPPEDFAAWRDAGDADFAYDVPDVARFRGNAARDRLGPIGVFRIIPARILSVDDLGISPEVQALCSLQKGLVLVTGPTGSGKSTTLAALIDLVNRTRSDHILTIEDPIEFVHQSRKCLVTQRQVGQHTRSFKTALRAALREDPDVVLVGEMRDLETIAIAIETAETGHLVFGTLHTTTAASTVDRIIDQFPADRQGQIRVMLSESLRGVVAQTLCRRKGGGRVAAYEVLLSTPAVSNLIREGKTFQIPSIMQTSRRLGMVTLNDALLDLIAKDLIEPREGYLRAIDRPGMAAALKAKGLDTSFLADG
jgi:twitching motility protein PilT